MNANGPLHRDGLAGIEERPELRHCDLVDGGIQSAWRARDCLHEKQSGAAQGCPAMSFALSDEQRMIQESARDFAMSEVLPIANEYDPERRDIPESLRAKLAEMGFFGITIPRDRKRTRLNSSH